MGITHLSGLEVAGVPTMGIGGAPMFTGNWYFVDAVNGNDGNSGAADAPMASVYAAYQRMVAGNNDVCVIVGNGSTSATQRLSYANALAANSSATSGSLIWAKNACHLIGMTAPTGIAARARFAPPTGTYTAATFLNGEAVASTPFVSVTASGCYFGNFSTFCGFSTGNAGMLNWSDSGGRNFYYGVQFGGQADAASAQGTASRSLVISGSGESTFVGCTIGLDTVTKTVANASLELKSGTTRNKFIECDFPIYTSSATTLAVTAAAAASIDRWTKFERCSFLNGTKSAGTGMTAIATLAASAGGYLLFKDCTLVGITGFGTDATSRGQIFIDGGAPAAATTGLAVAPTA